MKTNTLLELVGNTPLVRLDRFFGKYSDKILAKVEYFNPGGSIKDRIAENMIEDAEKRGLLKPGGTIVEPTSGNTGAGIAMIAAAKGYKAVLVMPDSMAAEKIAILKAYGAKVVLTPASAPKDDPKSDYSTAVRLSREIPNAFMPDQYYNQANGQAHYLTTGPEVWKQTEGKVTHFIAGMGTGGTISGVSRYLKEKNPQVKAIGVDPEGSIFSQPNDLHPFKTEGIGKHFFPGNLHRQLIDSMVTVSDRDAFLTAREVASTEGLLIGGSSGAALFAARKIAGTLKEGDLAVVLLPDSGKSYLSKIFNDEWMASNGYIEQEGKMQ